MKRILRTDGPITSEFSSLSACLMIHARNRDATVEFALLGGRERELGQARREESESCGCCRCER